MDFSKMFAKIDNALFGNKSSRNTESASSEAGACDQPGPSRPSTASSSSQGNINHNIVKTHSAIDKLKNSEINKISYTGNQAVESSDNHGPVTTNKGKSIPPPRPQYLLIPRHGVSQPVLKCETAVSELRNVSPPTRGVNNTSTGFKSGNFKSEKVHTPPLNLPLKECNNNPVNQNRRVIQKNKNARTEIYQNRTVNNNSIPNPEGSADNNQQRTNRSGFNYKPNQGNNPYNNNSSRSYKNPSNTEQGFKTRSNNRIFQNNENRSRSQSRHSSNNSQLGDSLNSNDNIRQGLNSNDNIRRGLNSNDNIRRGRCASKEIDPKHILYKFGYKKLRELVEEKDSDEIISHICQNSDIFEKFLQEKPDGDRLNLLIQVMVKAIGTKFHNNKVTVYALFCQRNFLDHLNICVQKYMTENDQRKLNSAFELFKNLNLIFRDLIDRVPSKAVESIDCLVNLIVVVLPLLSSKSQIFKELIPQCEKLKEEVEIIKERYKNEEKEGGRAYKREEEKPPNDFRELSLYPVAEDLRERSFLRSNIVEGSYEDPYHYLDVQFRLLREDFIDPLRTGILMYNESLTSNDTKKKRNSNIRIYRGIRILGMFNNNKKPGEELSYTVQMDPKFAHRTRWEYSKRLLYGSLCLFSRDNFETFQLATVSDRDVKNLKKGLFHVCLVGENVFGPDFLTLDFVMAESSAFFEPVYQVLNTMKELPIDKLPMERYLLVKDIRPRRPKYLEGVGQLNIEGKTVPLDYNEGWPSCDSLGFNESQLAALRASLRNEFTVIQGPPGTGKTYLGLKIVKTILNNIDLNSPILMVCYTNHALDQFLEGLLSVTDQIIRIGGQSKNEALNEFNYQVVKRKHRVRRHPAVPSIKDEMTRCLNKIASCNKLINDIQNSVGIVNVLEYNKDVRLKGVDSFESSLDFLSWLLGDLFQPLYYLLDQYGLKDNNKTDSDKNRYPEVEAVKDSASEEEDDVDDEDMRRRKYNDAFLDAEDVELLSSVKGEVHYSLTVKKLDSIFIHLQNILFDMNTQGYPDEAKQYIILDLQSVDYIRISLVDRLMNPDVKPSKRYSDLFKENLWGISENDRWALYHYWIRDIHKCFSRDVVQHQDKYSTHLNALKEIRVMEDYECLKDMQPKILGLTTTGAARHHTLIDVLKPKLIIVEEAAEVLEAHIVVSLTNSCQHLILIGDHKQLKPNPSTFKLAKDHHLDISLFERMLKNGVGCHTLNVQHRMKPNIASLIVPVIYEDLKNHESVELYPPVRGIAKNLFFIEHTIPERKDEDMESHSNPHEGDFMICLCRHLLLQGYEPSDITILTTYSAQQFYLRELKKQHQPLMRDVRITVVDNYQGEECKIILLSLVRSNEEASIGFLGTENRICVALSRAKHGLYIIGNMDILKQKSEIWRSISNNLQQQGAIGECLTLVCQIHGEVTEVKTGKDFDKVMEGGCSLNCLRLMPCGHTCKQLCHVVDVEHQFIQCLQPCAREICDEPTHSCPLRCHEKCKPCKVIMRRQLPQCDHVAHIPCHVVPSEHKCTVIVQDNKIDCKHPVERHCFQDINMVRCITPCDIRLDCGHACSLKCHINIDPDHLEFKCMKDCTKKNSECKSNHICPKRCHEECGKCVVKVKQTLQCGHTHDIECSADPALFKCTRGCNRIMDCGHKCRKLCHETCGDCKHKVEKTIAECGHKVNVECRKGVSTKDCKAPCDRKLPCGHACKLKCSQDCTKFQCKEYVPLPVPLACGHPGQVICYQQTQFNDGTSDSLLRYCREPCNKQLPCKDICSGTCGSCMQGRIHQVCQAKCGNTLICGHRCTVPCREDCPPCKENCLYRCKHSKCNKKCGIPCEPCKEKCNWRCKHKACSKLCGELCDRDACEEACERILVCGHPCVGFCGEPCPPLCRVCDRDTLCEVFFGTEDEEDARFVFLSDCKHTLEATGLDHWFSLEPEEGKDQEIGVKRCPKCKTVILTTQRYGNSIKKSFQQVQEVKKKIFGNQLDIRQLQNELAENLLPQIESLYRNAPPFVRESDNFKGVMSSVQETLKTFIVYNKKRKSFESGGTGIKLLEFVSTYVRNFLSLVNKMNQLYKRSIRPFSIRHSPESSNKCLPETEKLIKDRLSLLFFHLSTRKFKISNIEMAQFQSEYKRFVRFVDYALILNQDYLPAFKMSESAKTANDKILKELKSLDSYTDIVDTNLARYLEELRIGIKSSCYVSEQEKESVIRAMGFGNLKQGHWYQCSKGHLYAIANCGRANGYGICIQCKETVGGQGGRIVPTSRRIT